MFFVAEKMRGISVPDIPTVCVQTSATIQTRPVHKANAIIQLAGAQLSMYLVSLLLFRECIKLLSARQAGINNENFNPFFSPAGDRRWNGLRYSRHEAKHDLRYARHTGRLSFPRARVTGRIVPSIGNICMRSVHSCRKWFYHTATW